MKLNKKVLVAVTGLYVGLASAQNTNKLKVGLMLPYSGTYASLGNAIENGFQLYVKEQEIGRAHV